MPFLLPRLHSFFTPFLIDPDAASHDGWFSFEDVPLKWHYPLGLLYDLFSGASGAQPSIKDELDGGGAGTLPWRLRLHFTGWPDEQLVRLDAEGKVVHDAWINSVKEADFLRNGTAKGIMTLSKDHSTRFWEAVQHRTHPHPTQLYFFELTSSRRFCNFLSYLTKAPPCPRCSAPPCALQGLSTIVALRDRGLTWPSPDRPNADHACHPRIPGATDPWNSSSCHASFIVP